MALKEILRSPLSATYIASQSFVIAGDRLLLEFKIDVAAGVAAQVQWYLEFYDDDNANLPTPLTDDDSWYREISEVPTAGLIAMPQVIRTLKNDANADLPAPGIYRSGWSAPRLTANLARIKIRAVVGNVTLATVLATQSLMA